MNDKGDYFYIILQGEVIVQFKPGNEKVLKKGDVFGEVAMSNPNSKRTASVQCSQDCIFATINSANYNKVLPVETMRLNQVLEHLLDYPVFKNMELYEIRNVYKQSMKLQIKYKQTIFKQNDIPNAVYIVLEGEFLLMKVKKYQMFGEEEILEKFLLQQNQKSDERQNQPQKSNALGDNLKNKKKTFKKGDQNSENMVNRKYSAYCSVSRDQESNENSTLLVIDEKMFIQYFLNTQTKVDFFKEACEQKNKFFEVKLEQATDLYLGKIRNFFLYDKFFIPNQKKIQMQENMEQKNKKDKKQNSLVNQGHFFDEKQYEILIKYIKSLRIDNIFSDDNQIEILEDPKLQEEAFFLQKSFQKQRDLYHLSSTINNKYYDLTSHKIEGYKSKDFQKNKKENQNSAKSQQQELIKQQVSEIASQMSPSNKNRIKQQNSTNKNSSIIQNPTNFSLALTSTAYRSPNKLSYLHKTLSYYRNKSAINPKVPVMNNTTNDFFQLKTQQNNDEISYNINNLSAKNNLTTEIQKQQENLMANNEIGSQKSSSYAHQKPKQLIHYLQKHKNNYMNLENNSQKNTELTVENKKCRQDQKAEKSEQRFENTSDFSGDEEKITISPTSKNRNTIAQNQQFPRFSNENNQSSIQQLDQESLLDQKIDDGVVDKNTIRNNDDINNDSISKSFIYNKNNSNNQNLQQKQLNDSVKSLSVFDINLQMQQSQNSFYQQPRFQYSVSRGKQMQQKKTTPFNEAFNIILFFSNSNREDSIKIAEKIIKYRNADNEQYLHEDKDLVNSKLPYGSHFYLFDNSQKSMVTQQSHTSYVQRYLDQSQIELKPNRDCTSERQNWQQLKGIQDQILYPENLASNKQSKQNNKNEIKTKQIQYIHSSQKLYRLDSNQKMTENNNVLSSSIKNEAEQFSFLDHFQTQKPGSSHSSGSRARILTYQKNKKKARSSTLQQGFSTPAQQCNQCYDTYSALIDSEANNSYMNDTTYCGELAAKQKQRQKKLFPKRYIKQISNKYQQQQQYPQSEQDTTMQLQQQQLLATNHSFEKIRSGTPDNTEYYNSNINMQGFIVPVKNQYIVQNKDWIQSTMNFKAQTSPLVKKMCQTYQTHSKKIDRSLERSSIIINKDPQNMMYKKQDNNNSKTISRSVTPNRKARQNLSKAIQL